MHSCPRLAKDERSRLAEFAGGPEGVTAILPLPGADALEVAELETEPAIDPLNYTEGAPSRRGEGAPSV